MSGRRSLAGRSRVARAGHGVATFQQTGKAIDIETVDDFIADEDGRRDDRVQALQVVEEVDELDLVNELLDLQRAPRRWA